MVREPVRTPFDARLPDRPVRARVSWAADLAVRAGLALALALVAPLSALAQTGSITGSVTNAATNSPVSSAQVSVVGLSLGALTRADGRYLIQAVPAGTQEVSIQVMGYGASRQTVNVRSGETVVVNFRLREEAIALDEIVVTGVGAEARRREIGNSLAQIDMGDMEAKPIDNVESMLRGSVAGVQSLTVSGQAGAGGTIQLRGVTSVSQGNEPLVYVDGVRLASNRVPPANLEDGRGPRVSNMSLNDINPEDIARIEIIKGAAATTLYGTEASAGVVQIFTKKGTSGEPQWSMSMTGGANFWPEVGSVVDAHPTDLDLDDVRRTGGLGRISGSVRGGGEVLQYFISGQYEDENGIVDTQWSKSWGATGNFSAQLFQGMTIGFNTSYNRRRTRYVPDSNNRHGYILNVMRVGKGYYPGNRDQSWVLETELMGETDNFVTGGRLDYVHGDFSHKIQLGMHHVEASNSGLLPFGYYLYPKGSLGVQRWRDRTLTAEYTGSWATALSDALSSTLTVGGQLYDEERLSVDAGGLDFAGPGNHTISSAARTSSSEDRIREVNAGFFAQETLGWEDRLFLIAGVRVDGSSTFGDDYGFQIYPKLSASWVVSEESFLQSEFVNSLRLRAALGESGRAPGAFDAVRTWEPIAGMEGLPGVTPENLGNPDLGPERTRELELGFDASLADARLDVEFTYYDSKTVDALFPVLGTPTTGFSGAQVRNVGEITSSGIELSAQADLVRASEFNWSVGGNLTTTDSEVTDMGGAANISFGYSTEVRQGFAPPSIFGRRVTNPGVIGEPEFERSVHLGNVFPDLIVGANTELTLGSSLTLSAIGEWSRGGHIVNRTAYLNTVRDAWPTCDPVRAAEEAGDLSGFTALQRATCLQRYVGEDMFIESADFFKLRDVTLTFRIPEGLVPARLSTATLSVSGRDLYKSSDYTGLDPEVIEGGSSGLENFRRVDYYTLPPRRSIVAKLHVTF